MKKRFQVIPVEEINRDNTPFHPSEIIPLINVTNEVSSSDSPVPLFTTINEINQPSTHLNNRSLDEFKKNSSSITANQNLMPPPQSFNHSSGGTNGNFINKMEETDSNYLTVHSTVYDTNSLRLTDKFLYELRLKRRELHEKTKNLPIEQRIALNRRQDHKRRIRSKDIFNIHFELDDDDVNANDNKILDENLQETIRDNIFDELERQRLKKYYKQYRQLIYGRALLLIVTSILLFMSITLVYAVSDLYDRADYLDFNLPENKFLPMIYDSTETDP